MIRLGDAQTHRHRGVIGEPTLARQVQVLAALDCAVQPVPDVDVVVEVAQPSAADPAVWVIAAWAQLVCGTKADLFELVVQPVAGPRFSVHHE